LDTNYKAFIEQRQTGFDKALFFEWVTDLNAWTLRCVSLVCLSHESLARKNTDAADPVPSRRCPEKDNDVPNAFCLSEDEALLWERPHTQHIDQGIPCVTLVKGEFSTNRWHADRISIR
jgi:hypothetical protein